MVHITELSDTSDDDDSASAASAASSPSASSDEEEQEEQEERPGKRRKIGFSLPPRVQAQRAWEHVARDLNEEMGNRIRDPNNGHKTPPGGPAEKDLRRSLEANPILPEDLLQAVADDNMFSRFRPALSELEQKEEELYGECKVGEYCFGCDALDLPAYKKAMGRLERLVQTFHNKVELSARDKTVEAIFNEYEQEIRLPINRDIQKQIDNTTSAEVELRLKQFLLDPWTKGCIYRHFFTPEHVSTPQLVLLDSYRKLALDTKDLGRLCWVEHPDAAGYRIPNRSILDEYRKHARAMAAMAKDLDGLNRNRGPDSIFGRPKIIKRNDPVVAGEGLSAEPLLFNPVVE